MDKDPGFVWVPEIGAYRIDVPPYAPAYERSAGTAVLVMTALIERARREAAAA